VGITSVDGHRADRLHWLSIEYRLESRSAIDGLPHASARRANKDRDPAVNIDSVYGRDSAAHRSGANVPSRQP
jgi:hypothetical protein